LSFKVIMIPMRERTRTIGEVKARFAEHVRRAEGGETIVLTRHGRPVARLTPLGPRSVLSVGNEVREPEAAYGGPRGRESALACRREALERLLAEEIWPRVPTAVRGKSIDKREREEILGYGRQGV
jgi:prevent-host-death family protein